MHKKIPPYYVINWDFNHDDIENYDVMPRLVEAWEEMLEDKKSRLKKLKRHKERDFDAEEECKKIPNTFEEIKAFILDNSFYMFWSKCEYEVIVTGWPVQKHEEKIDVYWQIKSNIDVITKHFMDYLNIKAPQ